MFKCLVCHEREMESKRKKTKLKKGNQLASGRYEIITVRLYFAFSTRREKREFIGVEKHILIYVCMLVAQ